MKTLIKTHTKRIFKAIWKDLVQIARDPLGLDAELTALEVKITKLKANSAKLDADSAAWLREFNAVA